MDMQQNPNRGLAFDDKLVSLGIDAADCKQAIFETAKPLLREGYVKDSYPQAVWEREQVFATGLPLWNHCVAIPHTDAVHVKQSALAIGILNQPVYFSCMGEPERQEPVRVLFMLAIEDPNQQIDMLQQLTELFQIPEAIDKILRAPSTKEVAACFQKLMNEAKERL